MEWIAVPQFDMEDRLVWHHTSNEIYTVKSGYETALMLKAIGGW